MAGTVAHRAPKTSASLAANQLVRSARAGGLGRGLEFLHRADQLAGTRGFRHDPIDVKLSQAFPIFPRNRGRVDDDPTAIPGGVSLLDKSQAIQPRHLEVGDNELETLRMALHFLESRDAVARRFDVVTRPLEYRLEHSSDAGVVLDAKELEMSSP